jgi:hypothetical protein
MTINELLAAALVYLKLSRAGGDNSDFTGTLIPGLKLNVPERAQERAKFWSRTGFSSYFYTLGKIKK